MPNKPKRPCRYPSCPNLTDGVYCDEHQKLMNNHYNNFQRGYISNERYGKEWKATRNNYIQSHPLCEQCLTEGRYTPATLVHHKLPISSGGTNEYSNLMSLCSACHERIHRSNGDRTGRGGQNL